MEAVTIPPFSIFVGHGYLTQAGAGWAEMFCLHYHAYFIPSQNSLNNAVAFDYGTSSSILPSATRTPDDEEGLATVDIPEK